jgi:hypothetical protein
MIDMDIEGNEIKYFPSKFLVQKYLKYSTEDLKLNKKLKDQEIEELNLAGGEASAAAADQFSEAIDYGKLADMIVERMQAKNIITEVDDEDTKSETKPNKANKKPKKKAVKKHEEE